MKSVGYSCEPCIRPCRCIHMNRQALFTHDDLVRAVLAQQWVDACVRFKTVATIYRSFSGTGPIAIEVQGDLIADLPCAVDVVAEMLGEA